jgi:hypothetical protein
VLRLRPRLYGVRCARRWWRSIWWCIGAKGRGVILCKAEDVEGIYLQAYTELSEVLSDRGAKKLRS